MFDVLVYLFENYYAPESCPEADVLAKRLMAAGFEDDEIDEALAWLYQLAETTEQSLELSNMSVESTRVYAPIERDFLGDESINYLSFLSQSGALPAPLREIVINRCLDMPADAISLEHVKIITLMVLWSQEAQIDHLILEELLTDDEDKLLH